MDAEKVKKVSGEGSACSEWEADLRELMTLARSSFGGGDFAGAAECCRRACEDKRLSDDDAIVYEIYYLWCLAYLNTEKLDETLKVCSDARRRLGEYLDLAYFELIVAVKKGEPDDVLSRAQSYLRLWKNDKENNNPRKSQTGDRVGEVLLMMGQTLEQTRNTEDAIEIYKKYLALFPHDEAIESRLAQMSVPGKT